MSLQVNLTNKSATASSNIHWICFGLDANPQVKGSNPNWCYVDVDDKGNASLKKFTKGQNCAPLFNTIDSLDTFNGLPDMWSGQFLFSFNQLPKVFNIVNGPQNGIGVQTPPYFPGTPDADTVFVVVEFTKASNEIWADCTIVDYFCAPVSIEVIGDTTKTNGLLKSTSNRESIFDGIEALGTPWSNLIMKDSSGNNIRVLGPQHGVQKDAKGNVALPTTIYDDYVNACWDNFKNNTLTINCSTYGTYTGTVNGNDEFVFSQANKSDVTIQKPGPGKAFDIFGCVGTLNAPNATPLGEIAAILGAALNRTTLSTSGNDTQPNCDENNFYKVKDGVTNEYAKVVHQNYESGIYAFPFDDVCSANSPLIDITNPTKFNITISSWT